MYETLNEKDYQFLSMEDKQLLNKISAYSEKVLGEIDPQKIRISEQLEALKPVMQELAEQQGVSVEDIFIKYMDLASMVLAKKEELFKQDMQNLDTLDFHL